MPTFSGGGLEVLETKSVQEVLLRRSLNDALLCDSYLQCDSQHEPCSAVLAIAAKTRVFSV
jgi:hypothetical protein